MRATGCQCCDILHFMTRADIIAALRNQAPDIRSLGATSLYLFGSAARGEASDDSDVDLFVDYDPERFSFVELIRFARAIVAYPRPTG